MSKMFATFLFSMAFVDASADIPGISSSAVASTNSTIAPKSIPLRLGYLMFPEHRDNLHGAGTYPIRDILVDFVNKNATLLSYYNVSVDTYDTQYNVEHNVAKSIRLFTRHIASDSMEQNMSTSTNCSCTTAQAVAPPQLLSDGQRPVPLFFGPEYSGEAIVISQLATLYNVVHICGGTGAADLSDRSKYPNFFRTLMSGKAFTGLPRALLSYFNYTNVALLPRDLAYTEPMQQIDFDLTNHNFNVLFRVKFQVPENNNDSIDMVLDSIQLYDARVLIIWSIESDEDRIFCRTIDRWASLETTANNSRLPFSTEKYLVIFIAMIESPSWLEPNATGLLPKCQRKQLTEMLNGSLVAKYPLWSLPTDKLEFGLTNAELIEKAEALGRSRYGHPTGELAPLVPRTVDAIWLGFLGLDALDRRLRDESPSRSLVDFTFQSKDVAQMLVDEIKKTRFMGTNGLFKFDSNADVSGQIFVEQYRPGYGESSIGVDTEYVRVLKFDTEKLTVEPVAGEQLVFGTATGKPPPDRKRPVSGPDQSGFSLSMIVLIAIAAAVLVIVCASAGWYVYYRRKLAENLARPTWFVDFSLLAVHDEAQQSIGSSLYGMASAATEDQRKSYATIVTDGATLTAGQKIAHLNNQAVTLQLIPVEAPPLVIGVRNYRILAAMRDDLNHDNIVKFFGYCVEPAAPTAGTKLSAIVVRQYLVWERCDKGSLEQLIENGALFSLDTLLESAIVLDVARGMAYLHSQHAILQNSGAHGKLCAATCLIDKRFSVKVANYGDAQLAREMFGLKTLSLPSVEIGGKERLFYLAPEILRQQDMYNVSDIDKIGPFASPAADVYAYGVTMFALISRAPPYESSQKNMEQIISLVKSLPKNGQQPFRPSTEATPLTNDARLVALLERCWAELPTARPSFVEIVKNLQQISGIKAGTSVTDQLLQRLERYASDMESLVRERTYELEGEKRRSDALLNAMLPPDIALELKSNGFVQPESYESVTIYFSDIVGFTTLSAGSTPIEVVNFLNALYTMFDARIDQFDAYKVETIGDAYMVVSGLPRRNGTQHAAEIAKLSLALLLDIKSFVIPHRPGEKLQLRIGLHTGPCVAGVVGTKMPRYCFDEFFTDLETQ